MLAKSIQMRYECASKLARGRSAMPNSHLTNPPANGFAPFEEDLRAAVQGVRGALAEIVAAADVDATKPQQMARDVGLDKSLSWKLSRILNEEDAVATALHLPGKAGLRIVLRSFEKAGASEQSLNALRNAVSDFDRMIEVHCGDRETLELMLGHLRRDGQAQHDEALRKKSFQGNSAIWGVQARVHIAAQFAAPSASDPDVLDFATVSGLVDFRRLRSEVPWAVASVRQYSDDGTVKPVDQWEPIDQSMGSGEVPLLREFSTHPPPNVRVAPGLPGITRYEIVEGPVGNTGVTTCLTGWIDREVAVRHRTESDRFGEHVVSINTPAELLIFDLFVHRDIGFNMPPQLLLYSQLPGGPLYPKGGRDRGILPLREEIIRLGEGPPDMVTPEIPRYHVIMEQAMRRLRDDPSKYMGFRLKLRYPPIPTMAVYRHTLPEPRSA